MSSLYFKQLLVGHDVASDDPFAIAMRNFVYLVGDLETKKAIVVDPAYAPADYVAIAEADGMELVGAFATHFHADHIGGVLDGYDLPGIAKFLEIIDVPIHIQRSEAPWIERSIGGVTGSLQLHDGGDVLAVGNLEFTSIHTPGHTPGSQCLYGNGLLITGDTLFLRGCGRTDLPGGDPGALYESLQQTLAPVPAETIVFAGHAYSKEPAAPLGELRENNPVLFTTAKETWLRRFTDA